MVFLSLKHFILKNIHGNRMLFFHVTKSAGTSLSAYLRPHFNEKQIKIIKIGDFQNTDFNAALKHFSYIQGHFSFYHFNKKQREFKDAYKLTVLREPVSRMISSYRYGKANALYALSQAGGSVSDLPKYYSSFLDFSEHTKWVFGFEQLRQFCNSEIYQPCEDDLLTAKSNLNLLDFIGFTESFKHDLSWLAESVGATKKLVSKNLSKNKTDDYFSQKSGEINLASMIEKVELGARELNYVREKIKLEIDFYEFAKELYRQKAMLRGKEFTKINLARIRMGKKERFLSFLNAKIK